MRAVLAPCLLALALAACGGAAPRDSAQEFEGAERAVAATIEGVEDAARDDDPEQLCTRLLSEELLATLERQGTNCRTAVKDAFDDADSYELTVEDVSISGDTATAKVTSGTGSAEKTDTLQLEKAGGGWRISALRS
ncbi:MAG TPA: nuclear transport factor 2 family protein [Solirubrobacteraceae bacterium]|nr:nuclear transport factor 2 family protein [Solirubrobacteraceae bacterium]